MKVRRYDYEGQIEDWPGLMARIEAALRGGDYVLGATVKEFEQRLARYLDAPSTLAVNCGTDALVLALRAAGIGAGDRVVTQANTFHATVAAILLAGATPVLVDAHPESFTMDVDSLSGVEGPLRAVLPVHLYGRPCEMDGVLAFAERSGLSVIEDSAQAIGARHRGRRAGAIGDFGCFSFHPSKNLAAAGDGGAIVLRDTGSYDELVALRSLGQVAPNDHRYVGLNSKLDVVQALVLLAKLDRLDSWNQERRDVAHAYRERLGALPLGFQSDPEEIEHVYHLFQVRTSERDRLLDHLRGDGIDAVVRYPEAIPEQRAFADRGWKRGQFPVAEALARELLALPIRPGMREAEIDHVCDSVHRFFGGSGA